MRHTGKLTNTSTKPHTENMPSAVDWSEFHVWTYRVSDDLKRNRKSLRDKMALAATAPAGKFDLQVIHRFVNPLSINKPKPRVKRRRKISMNGHPVYAQFAAGAVGGGTATYATHWLDTIKVRMQAFPQLYRTSTQCLIELLKTQGVRGLYQGAVPAVLGHTSKTAIVFMSYGICEEYVRRLTGAHCCADLSVWHHATAGAMTGMVASFILCPLEVLKCRMQATHTATPSPSRHIPQRVGSARLAYEIMRAEGLPGMYRGLTGIWVKDIPGSFIYFGSYELFKAGLRNLHNRQELSSGEVFVSGVFAGLCFCVTHPIESVKTRVQVMDVGPGRRGFLGAAVHILRTEGIWPLCNGLRPSMLRACLYSGIQFLAYEGAKDYFLRDPES